MRYAFVLATAVVLGVSKPLESAEAPAFDQAVVLDVQGLFGGNDLWVRGDGQAWVRFVTPPKKADQRGLQEEIYKFTVAADDLEALAGVINDRGFFSIRVKERPGIPDEGRPTIYVKAGERERAVAKWGSDKHADFDAILDCLKRIAGSGRNGERLFSRPLDRNWRPEGFPDAERIRRSQTPPA